ncbi:MAG TPA: carboxypeptidase regulatory-like domain-containing protein, partial [Planctomycetes bacterium]|nr:carboxypeptidase regulatory-like domain-containing protein [Planctomycetota bacterium]
MQGPEENPGTGGKKASPEDLAVKVVDTRGNPVARVPVAIVEFHNNGEGWGKPKYTNQMGLAVFPKIGSLYKNQKKPKTSARLLVPAKQTIEKDFDPLSLPRKPLVLTLPPTGKVVVHVVGPGGPPADGTVTVTLKPVRKGKKEGLAQVTPDTPVKGGKAVFPFVGLGLYLRLYPKTNVNDVSFLPEPPAAEGPGPTVPGGTVVFHIALTEGITLITGRILLSSGAPLSKGTKNLSQVFLLKRNGNFVARGVSQLKTDEKGRFRFPLPSGSSWKSRSHATSRILEIHLPYGKTGGDMKAVIDLSRSFLPGTIDLGDIRLVPPVFLASGKVTDSSGRPLPGAEIEACVKKRVVSRSYLSSLTDHSALSDEQGRFRVYGKDTKEAIILKARKAGWLPEKAGPVSPGTRGVHLTLWKGGRLRADFRLGPSLSLKDLELKLVFQEPGGKKRRLFTYKREGNQVLWESLPTGKATLEVFLPSCRDPLLKIPDIEVIEGKETKDPRLEGIDLSSRILVLDLVLEDTQGNPIPFARILGPGRHSV